jgi:hypothetical protein
MAEKDRIGVAVAQAIDVQGYTAEGIGVAKVARVHFNGGVDGAAGLFAVQLPETRSVVVTRALVVIQTPSTAACTIDVGTASTAVLASNLIAAAAAGAAASSVLASTAVAPAAPGPYLTGSTASGASAGLSGVVLIEYLLV